MSNNKSINELLNEQNQVSTPVAKTETQAQEVSGYTSDAVITLIKKSLNIHWQQTTVLTAQAEHLERWGYKKLAAIIKEDAIQEQTHAAINIKRLEFFI